MAPGLISVVDDIDIVAPEFVELGTFAGPVTFLLATLAGFGWLGWAT